MLKNLRKKIKGKLLSRWSIPYSPVFHVTPVIYREFAGRNNVTIIDVGAHGGDFTRGITQTCQIERALLVEPLPNFAALLMSDAQLRTFRIEACAISDFDGVIELNYYPNAPYISSALDLDLLIDGMPEIAQGTPERIVCPARTLDSLVANGPDWPTIDLLKIDVQGLEDRVIAGAQETLTRTRSIFTEVSFRPVYRGSCDFTEVYRLLGEHGFVLSALESGHRTPDGELLQADALFKRRA